MRDTGQGTTKTTPLVAFVKTNKSEDLLTLSDLAPSSAKDLALRREKCQRKATAGLHAGYRAHDKQPTISMILDPLLKESLLQFAEPGNDLRGISQEEQDVFLKQFFDGLCKQFVPGEKFKFLPKAQKIKFRPELETGIAIIADYHSKLVRLMKRHGMSWTSYSGRFWADKVFVPAVRPVKVQEDLLELLAEHEQKYKDNTLDPAAFLQEVRRRLDVHLKAMEEVRRKSDARVPRKKFHAGGAQRRRNQKKFHDRAEAATAKPKPKGKRERTPPKPKTSCSCLNCGRENTTLRHCPDCAHLPEREK